MTDSAGTMPPFPGFPGFPPAEMLDKMWGMMRLTPFGSAFPGMPLGAAPGGPPSLSAMPPMMGPLMSVEELDKRVTDMRAVEQWLKLNLNMLQSAIQALEVQRSTLATLQAFGSFAQASMAQAAQGTQGAAAKPAGEATPDAHAAASRATPPNEEPSMPDALGAASFDPSGWWNLLQTQFNQLAQFAVAQPGVEPNAEHAQAQDAAGFAKHAEPETRSAVKATASKTSGEPETAAAGKRPATKRAVPKPAAKAGGK
jgi:hypothetical protein